MENNFDYLKPLQETQFNMLQDFDAFCIKNNIDWSLAYGSVLGAVRHKGPIPWDDDIDVMMTKDNYEKFRTIFGQNGDKEKYYLQEMINIDGKIEMAKLRLNNTTFIEESKKNLKMHHGIFMDIFVIHNAPNVKIKQKLGIIMSIYLQMKIMSNQHYNKRKAFVPIMWFMRLFPKIFGMRLILNKFYKWDKYNSDNVTVWGMNTKIMDKNILFPFKRIEYMGQKFPVPNNYERYLEINYGDWKKIPNITNISWSQHSSNWDISKDFRTYLPNIDKFSDEIKI